MRAKAQSLLPIFFLGLGYRLLSAQANNPDESLRYRLIQVVETTVLVDKVNEAAKDGYRLTGVAPASGGTTVAVLEKTADPQNAYSYLLLGGKGDPALAQSLNEAGAKGYRLVSRNVALDWRSPVPLQLRTVVAWMEKPPGPATKVVEYSVIPFGVKSAMKATLNPKYWADLNPLDYVKPEVTLQQEQGFRLVRIVSGVALIFERSDDSNIQPPASSSRSSVRAQADAFHSLTSLRGSKLQRKLQEQAAGGYCIVDMDPEAPPVWPSILLDKSESASAGGTANPCAYEVLEKRDLGEDEFNQEGARGFRLVPQSLNLYGLNQLDPRRRVDVNAVFEHSSAANLGFHYREIAAVRLPDLADKLEQAGAEGYRAVKVDGLRDGSILVVMEKSEDLGSRHAETK
jgi:hypothetical protein